MNNIYEQAKELLKKYDQEHLLRFYNDLNEEEKKKLLDKIVETDFESVKDIYESLKVVEDNIEYSPIEITEKAKLTEEEKIRLTDIGNNVIKNNQYAVVLMSGGQGTRLGYNGPKAFFPLEFLDGITILELQATKILQRAKELGGTITLYIMTNTDNHRVLKEYVVSHHYFGFGENNIRLFPQGDIPLIDKDCKILMDSKSSIIEVPNGNGGIYSSLKNTGMIEDMKRKGIKYILTCNIDNILAQVADSIFVGLIDSERTMLASKSVIKTNAHERVGAFCLKNGRPGVSEYSDISEEMAESTDENGNLKYGDSYFGCSILSIKGLEIFADAKMPYHKAVKKYKYLDENGNMVEPEEPNAYKFEKFIFDSYKEAERMPILRVIREEEFAPVKNKEGVDSPESAKELYINYYRKDRLCPNL